MSAALGSRPSFAWRSIIHGRELLSKGMIKVIGNGQDTRVWTENWIYDGDPRRPINRTSMVSLDLRVSELLLGSGEWNKPLLESLIVQQDAHMIMSMPTKSSLPDGYLWPYTESGTYSVKTGAWLLRKHSPRLGMIPRDNDIVLLLKQKTCQLETVPKIKMFIWRALSGALAVADFLNRRGLKQPVTCPLCSVGEETIVHVLFVCPLAGQLWELCRIPCPVQDFSNSLEDNIGWVFGCMEDTFIPLPIRQSIPWILWGIWKNRNGRLLAGSKKDLMELSQCFFEEASNWFRLNMISEEESQPALMQTCVEEHVWSRPGANWLKVNVAAVWRNATSTCGGSWISRDASGEVQFHSRSPLPPSQNKIVAVLQALIWSITSMVDLRHTQSVFAIDCMAAWQAIQTPSKWPRYRTWLDSVSTLMQDHEGMQVANQISMAIASSVTRDGRLQSYLSLGGPSWLHDRIAEEALASV